MLKLDIATLFGIIKVDSIATRRLFFEAAVFPVIAFIFKILGFRCQVTVAIGLFSVPAPSSHFGVTAGSFFYPLPSPLFLLVIPCGLSNQP
jgi:hypothetical protein